MYRAATQKRYRDRKAKHERGDHSACDPRYCTSAVTGNATSNKTAHETPSPPVPSRPKDRGQGQSADRSGADAPPGAALNDWRQAHVEHLTDEYVAQLIAQAGDVPYADAAKDLYKHAGGKWTTDGDRLDATLWRDAVAYVLLKLREQPGDQEWPADADADDRTTTTTATTTDQQEAAS